MVGMRKPLSILHSSAYANDCASQERPRCLFRPVLFLCNDFTCFAGICGGICTALLDGKNDTVLRFAVIVEQQLFYSKVIGAGKADNVPRQLRLARILFKFPGGILVRTRCGGKAPAMGRRSVPADQIVLFRLAWLAALHVLYLDGDTMLS